MGRKAFITALIGIFGGGALLVLSCGGGGGGDGTTSMALSGTWVSECFPRDGSWAWEKYVFDGYGAMNGFLEEFGTDDCSDTGVVLNTMSGTYSTGSEVDCPTGFENKCRELDMSREGSNTMYLLYSLFPGDPNQIYLSSNSADPATRPSDVVIDERSRLRNVPCPGCTGEAIIALAVTNTGLWDSTPSAPAGYTALNIDLNGGTGGDYIWLSYKMGRADGLEGAPINTIYTVHESGGETPVSGSDTLIDVDLNGSTFPNNNLYLYYRKATGPGPVLRCVVVANETKDVTVYGPPSTAGFYTITWVEELQPDNLKTPSEYPEPPDAQDLNEGQGIWTDYIFLGYGRE